MIGRGAAGRGQEGRCEKKEEGELCEDEISWERMGMGFERAGSRCGKMERELYEDMKKLLRMRRNNMRKRRTYMKCAARRQQGTVMRERKGSCERKDREL